MSHPYVLTDAFCQALVSDLSLSELARIAPRVSAVLGEVTGNEVLALYAFQCLASQISDVLPCEQRPLFEALLLEHGALPGSRAFMT